MDNLQLDFPEFDPITFNDVQYEDSGGQNSEVNIYSVMYANCCSGNYILIAMKVI